MDTQSIVTNGQNISLDSTTGDNSEFCKIWPEVQEGLQLLQGLVKNPFVKVSIGAVIAAGQAVSQQVCGA
jgi:hypothetical protein